MIVNVAFDLSLLNFVAMVVIVLLSYVLLLKYRKRALVKNMAFIREQILAFFDAASVQVEVSCFTSDNTKKFTICIDSQPLKRFKFSHLVEMALIRFVTRTTNLPVERVYWRFSLPPETENEMLSPIDSASTENIGFKDNYEEDAEDSYKVAETSWDNFEKALQLELNAKEAKKIFAKTAETIA